MRVASTKNILQLVRVEQKVFRNVLLCKEVSKEVNLSMAHHYSCQREETSGTLQLTAELCKIHQFASYSVKQMRYKTMLRIKRLLLITIKIVFLQLITRLGKIEKKALKTNFHQFY